MAYGSARRRGLWLTALLASSLGCDAQNRAVEVSFNGYEASRVVRLEVWLAPAGERTCTDVAALGGRAMPSEWDVRARVERIQGEDSPMTMTDGTFAAHEDVIGYVRGFSAGCDIVVSGCAIARAGDPGSLAITAVPLAEPLRCQATPCLNGRCSDERSVCGDGRIVYEGCDDENALSGDGCSSECELEGDLASGWHCESGGIDQPTLCEPMWSCYDHYLWNDQGDGIYGVRAGSDLHVAEVYCDMSSGGWTMLLRGVGGNIDGWDTAAHVEAPTGLASGTTWKLSDDEIRTIRLMRERYSAYWVRAEGRLTFDRYVGHECVYGHTAPATGRCAESAATVDRDGIVPPGDSGPPRAGWADLGIADSYAVTNDPATGWRLSDGASECDGTQADCTFTLWMW